MLCKFSLLRRKEVINLCDGCRLGCVGDVEVTVPEGSVKALIVFGPCRFFGLFGRGEDYYIPGSASRSSVMTSFWWINPSAGTRRHRPAVKRVGFSEPCLLTASYHTIGFVAGSSEICHMSA